MHVQQIMGTIVTNKLNPTWSYYHNKFYFEPTFSSLHSNVKMYFLHTVVYTFPKVLTRRIC